MESISYENHLRSEFRLSLGTNPTLNNDRLESLFDLCTGFGEDMSAVYRASGEAARQASLFIAGHPQYEEAMDQFVALQWYEKHLEQLKEYRTEVTQREDLPRFSVI